MLDGYNLFTGLHHVRRGKIASWIADFADYLTQPIRWATGQERSDSFVRDDLRPAVWECALLCKSVSQKLMRLRGSEAARRRSSEQPA